MSDDLLDCMQRASTAEDEIRQILTALKSHCNDDFVVISDGGIDWRATIAEFVSFICLDEQAMRGES